MILSEIIFLRVATLSMFISPISVFFGSPDRLITTHSLRIGAKSKR